jgi:hypothetical protein
MRTITITVDVKKLKTDQEALEFAQNLSEHICGTFNDDNSLYCVRFGVEPKGGK